MSRIRVTLLTSSFLESFGSWSQFSGRNASFSPAKAMPTICIRDGEPIYYHGPHELCVIAGGLQKQFYPKLQPLSNYEEE